VVDTGCPFTLVSNLKLPGPSTPFQPTEDWGEDKDGTKWTLPFMDGKEMVGTFFVDSVTTVSIEWGSRRYLNRAASNAGTSTMDLPGPTPLTLSVPLATIAHGTLTEARRSAPLPAIVPLALPGSAWMH
jgi:hypothetical protein